MTGHRDNSAGPHEGDSDRSLVEYVAPPLRAPETLAPGFEERLMASVRREALALYPPQPRAAPQRQPRMQRARSDVAARLATWWNRPRVLRISPASGLALAAGFATIVCLGTLSALALDRVLRADGEAPAGESAGADLIAMPPSTRDTVHIVRFVFVDPQAKSVVLVGDFNRWAAEATPLVSAGVDGVWSVSVALAPGRHEYAFIIDGGRWVADPFAPKTRDDFSTESSIVTVGSAPDRSRSINARPSTG